MNIQEVEMETGMSRANIRYYEKRGFLSPERRENSYRDYSDKDVKTLKRIKLLRQMDISLETLARLENDEISLSAALEERIASVGAEIQTAQKQMKLCRKMQAEGATYRNLRVESYLREFERDEGDGESLYQYEQADQEPPVKCATRRVMARYIDLLLYTVMMDGVLYLLSFDQLFRYPMQWLGIVVSIALAIPVMVFLEPVLLAVFGRTLGKWILGLKISGLDGRRLGLERAKERTRTLMFYWIFSWSGPNYERYHAMENNESMLWESTDEVEAEECEIKHSVGGILTVVILLFVLGLLIFSLYLK